MHPWQWQRKSMEGATVCSRIGRRGDPRMHRAVVARIENPSLSLFQALQIGGFEYSNEDDPNSLDSEQVSLIQRKNQLSRRIRYALRQQQSPSGNMHSKHGGSLKDHGREEHQRGDQQSAKKRRNLTSVDMTEFESIVVEEIQKTLEVDSTDSTNNRVEQPNNDWQSIISENEEFLDLYSSYNSPIESPETNAFASLHDTATAMGMNLEQLASLLHRCMKKLATTMQRKSTPLLLQSMLPIKDHQEAESNHEASLVHQHLQGALSTWQQEGQRLRLVIAQCKEQGRTPILHQPTGNGKPHIDFLVDHCVECYSGMLPPRHHSLDDAGESRSVTQPAEFSLSTTTDPIILDRNDIDWESDEWDFDLLRSESLVNIFAWNDHESPPPTANTNSTT